MKRKTMLRGVSNWFNKKAMPVFGRISNQRHLLAIRNGIVSMIPFIIVGALAFLVINIPTGSNSGDVLRVELVKTGNKYAIRFTDMLLYMFAWGVNAMGLLAASTIGASLAKSYGLSQTMGGVLGLFGFLMWFPAHVGYGIIDDAGNKFAVPNLWGGFGGKTIFVSIIASIGAVEIYHMCKRFGFTVKMPSSVPPSVANSFATLIPAALVGLIYGSFRFILNFDFNNFLTSALEPLQNFLTGSLVGMVVVVILVCFFWFFGIHGDSLVGSIVRPFWELAIVSNMAAYASGIAIPYDYPEMFLQWFIWIGGSGATIGFVVLGTFMMKSQQGKAVSRAAIIPGIFNINEPAIFGYPIMLNPILFLPFIFIPVAMAIPAGLIQRWADVHWVARAPWTLPGPIGALMSAGWDWKAGLISLGTTAISFLGWLPFVKLYDRQQLKMEKEQLEEEKAAINSTTKIKA